MEREADEACGTTYIMESMLRAEDQKTDPPQDYLKIAVVSIFFCPFLGVLAIVMSEVSKTRYSEGKFKRAQDAARDAKFSAIFGIAFGIAIALFFLWLYVIVPAF